MAMFMIYDPDREMYWKQGQFGYTENVEEAGQFVEEFADSICNQPYTKDYKVEVN